MAFQLGRRAPWPSWLRLYQPIGQQTLGLPVSSGFNDCKFVITPTTKFSAGKPKKNILKTYQKSLKAKQKNNNNKLSSIEGRKVGT